jgi:hypothetical protein
MDIRCISTARGMLSQNHERVMRDWIDRLSFRNRVVLLAIVALVTMAALAWQVPTVHAGKAPISQHR